MKSRARSVSQRRAVDNGALEPPRRNDLRPKLVFEDRPLASFGSALSRLRSADMGDMFEVANSIRERGFLKPIIVDRHGRIVDGEILLQAARYLELETVPCLTLEHLSEAEARAARIALNRIGQTRSWDLEALRVEIEELIIEDQPIELLGFEGIVLDQILLDDTDEEEEADDDPDDEAEDEIDANQVATSRDGDIWQLGEHRLLCGDAKDPQSYRMLLGDERAQLVLTDPPWNIAVKSIVSTRHREFVEASGEMSEEKFFDFLLAYLTNCYASLIDGGVALSFIDYRQIEKLLRASREAGFTLLDIPIWIKDAMAFGAPWRSRHEMIVAGVKPGAPYKNRVELGKHGRNRSNCWFAAGAGTPGSEARAQLENHPSSKPPSLLIDAILDLSDRGDLVLDCFGGSGSTLIACERTGRIARMIEADPIYCDVILRRWAKATGKEPVLATTGETFDQIAMARIQPETLHHAD